jgi:hypothetical protein
MNRRLKWSLLGGFVLSIGLHIAVAIQVAFFPAFRDKPMIPHPIFLILLLPGWMVADRSYPVQLWEETLAAVINGAFYSVVALGLFSLWTWSKAERQ